MLMSAPKCRFLPQIGAPPNFLTGGAEEKIGLGLDLTGSHHFLIRRRASRPEKEMVTLKDSALCLRRLHKEALPIKLNLSV